MSKQTIKRPIGRPFRGHRKAFGVRLTDQELSAWEAKRTAHGVSWSELIRRGVASLPSKPK
jgi:hypothetical protein